MAPVVSSSAAAGGFDMTLDLKAIWDTVGNELAIFAATLVFALLFRKFGNQTPRSNKVKRFEKEEPPLVTKAPVPQKPVAPDARIAPRARDAAVVLDEIVMSMCDQPGLRTAGRALQVYHDELRELLKKNGLSIQEVARRSKNSPLDLYTTLVHCAIRSGRHHLVEPFLDDMAEYGVQRTLAFYESTMKQLAGQKQHHLALAVYDRLDADGLKPSAVTCSCLVGFAAEVGELDRAVQFFEKLSTMTTPSIRAYMTILRVHAKRQDFEASTKILRDMEARGVGPDSLALNVVLSTGISADKIDAVAELVSQCVARRPRVSDVVSHNTLIKGYAQRGDAAGALKALEQMKEWHLQPNAITYNTTMDAAVRGGEVRKAWRLLEDMRKAGIRPDKFSCSILVKGLVREASCQHVNEALALLQDVGPACDATLRSSLYHGVLDAASKAKGPGAGAALLARVFAQMRTQHVQPTAAAQRLLVQTLPSASQ